MPPKLAQMIKAPPIEIGTKFQVGQRADLDTAALPERAGALPEPLQVIARNYVGARRRSGEALLDMCRWLNEAHELAKHGDWKLFLEATSTSDDTAERLLNIHRLAMENTQYADAIARNWLTQSTAALLARESTPPELVDQALSAPEPPTKRQIESSIRATKIRTGADFDDEIPPPERRGERRKPGQSEPPPWPAAPEGWRWNRRGAPAHLIAPDGWTTHDYNYPERAIAEAQRRILSMPKAEREAAVEADRLKRGLPPVPSTGELAEIAFPDAPIAPTSAPPRTDDHLPAHWFGPTRGKFVTTAELAKWAGGQRDRLSEEERAWLAEDMNQLIVELERAIEALS